MPTKKELARTARHDRIRARVQGTAARPRLVVSRSLKHIRAQIVNDDEGRVLAAVSDMDLKTAKGTKTARSTAVGAEIAKKAIAQNISAVVFDRTGRKYHGRVKAVADAAREAGLKF